MLPDNSTMAPVQSDSAIHIFICGAHSVGKTTLVNALHQQQLPFEKVPEVARQVIKEQNLKTEDFDPETNPAGFKSLNKSILLSMHKMILKYDRINAIFDRGPDSLNYMRYYLGRAAYEEAIASDVAKDCLPRFCRSLVFVIEPYEPYIVRDEVRLVSTIEELRAITRSMCDMLQELGVEYTLIHQTALSERVSVVLERLQQFTARKGYPRSILFDRKEQIFTAESSD